MTKTPNIREAEQQEDFDHKVLAGLLHMRIKQGLSNNRQSLDSVTLGLVINELLPVIATQRQQSAQAARREELLDFNDWMARQDWDLRSTPFPQIKEHINRTLATLGDVVGEQR